MIHVKWFKTLPKRAWNYGFWANVDAIRRKRGVRANDLIKIDRIACEVDSKLTDKINKLSK